MYGIYMSVAWSTLWSGMRTLVTSLTMDNISALLKHQTSSQPAQVFFFFCEETQDVLHIKEMKKKDQTQKKKKKNLLKQIRLQVSNVLCRHLVSAVLGEDRGERVGVWGSESKENASDLHSSPRDMSEPAPDDQHPDFHTLPYLIPP